ncbi:MAG: hypothetical protein K2M31_01525 [Muribaculaceae bacterium]|nr:hypothetical protein [Muribaculaceae bacterium]
MLIILSLVTSGCNISSDKKTDDTAKQAPVVEEFHADHDIAMTVRSIIDAINVGEKLDSVDYNYTGVMTDGNGRPLYTDVMGSPGVWDVEVRSENSVIIRNLYLGDLLPDELVQYLLQTLDINDAPILTADDSKKGTEDNLTIYPAGNADLIIEQQTAKTPKGDEGPLLKIILRKTDRQSSADSSVD